MGDYCYVYGCFNRRKSLKSIENAKNSINLSEKLSFYKIPAILYHTCQKDEVLSRERQHAWLANNIHRDDLNADKIRSYRVCSVHFHSGK